LFKMFILALVALSLPVAVLSHSTGAPCAVTATSSPNWLMDSNNAPGMCSGQTLLTDTYSVTGLPTSYTAGAPYTITLPSTSYQGTAIYASAGTFAVGTAPTGGSALQAMSACTPPIITHSESASKTGGTVTWTAPATGSGTVTFTLFFLQSGGGSGSCMYQVLTPTASEGAASPGTTAAGGSTTAGTTAAGTTTTAAAAACTTATCCSNLLNSTSGPCTGCLSNSGCTYYGLLGTNNNVISSHGGKCVQTSTAAMTGYSLVNSTTQCADACGLKTSCTACYAQTAATCLWCDAGATIASKLGLSGITTGSCELKSCPFGASTQVQQAKCGASSLSAAFAAVVAVVAALMF